MPDLPVLARQPNPDRESVEVRVRLDPTLVAVIDGCAGNDGLDRTALIRRWLEERGYREHLNAIRLVRVAGSNPLPAPSDETSEN